MLGRINADLKETFSTVHQVNEYQDKATRLDRQLLAVHLLAGAYSPDAVHDWLAPWQQLQRAIREQQHASLDWLTAQAMKQSPFWLTSGSPR